MWHSEGVITGVKDNNLIIGTNTNFTKALPTIKGGMMLFIDNIPYEIDYVVNDTELRLVTNLQYDVTDSNYQIVNTQTDLMSLTSDYARSVTHWNDFCKQYYKLVTSDEDSISFKDMAGIGYNLPTYQYIAQHSGLPLVNNQQGVMLQHNGIEWEAKSIRDCGLYTKQELDVIVSNLENRIRTLELTIESMEQRLDALEN